MWLRAVTIQPRHIIATTPTAITTPSEVRTGRRHVQPDKRFCQRCSHAYRRRYHELRSAGREDVDVGAGAPTLCDAGSVGKVLMLICGLP